MNRSTGLSAVVMAIIMVGPGFLMTAEASISGVQPPTNGNWDITSTTTAINETITLHGNIIVRTTLNLQNTTIIFDGTYNGQYGIDVLSGGTLNLLDWNGAGSNITSSNQYSYTFKIRNGASATLQNSEIHKCGYYTGTIGQSSGLYIDSSNVVIKGCAITANYVGIVFNSRNQMEIDSSISTSMSYITQLTNNQYGIYAIQSSVQFNNVIFGNNSNYDLYLDDSSNAQLTDCYPMNPSKAGPGPLTVISTPNLIFDIQDYFEVEYNTNGQTFRYTGWISSGGNNYASVSCVVRRGYDYTIKENLAALKSYLFINYPFGQFAAKQCCGYSFDIVFNPDVSPEASITKPGNSRLLSVPSTNPISYCTLICNVLWRHGHSYSESTLCSMTIFIIFNLPPTSGSDQKTELTSDGRAEYLYMNDAGSVNGLPDNIDKCGPYFKKQNNQKVCYYYGTTNSNIHQGMDIFDVYWIACSAAYGSADEWAAILKIKAFVNIYLHGDWIDSGTMAWTNDVYYHIQYVTNEMASAPVLNINDIYHADSYSTSDSLGLYCGYPNHQYAYIQNTLQYQCHDFAAISTSLERSIGVAARQVTGLNYSGGTYSWTYHVWTEVWIPDDGDAQTSYDNQWVVLDACGVDLDINGSPIDDNMDSPDRNTRTDYYSNLNTVDFGTPAGIYAIFVTGNNVINELALIGEYT